MALGWKGERLDRGLRYKVFDLSLLADPGHPLFRSELRDAIIVSGLITAPSGR